MAKFNIVCNLPSENRGVLGIELWDQNTDYRLCLVAYSIVNTLFINLVQAVLLGEASLCTAKVAYSYRVVLLFSDHKFLLRTVCLLIQILHQLVY